MASTMAIPQFYNFPGAIPGPLPGPMPGPLPHIPITTAYGGPHNNGIPTFQNIPIQMQVPIVPVGGGCYNDGMEVVWHGEFSRLFSSFYPPHVWYLTITNSAPPLKWKFHRDSAKVRFCCQDCGNGWTSMKGRVTFWFHLDYATNSGYVQFKLYGQQCKKCNSGKFEYVMWYPEEVSKVMCNVYNKVGQTYYGFLQPPIRIDRRPGRPRNQHNSDLCQACRDGECDQARPIKSLYNLTGMIQAPLAIPAPPVPDSVDSIATSGSSPIPGPVVSFSSSPVPQDVVVTSPSSSSPPPPTQVSSRSIITSPITLTGGVQPILTYSIMSAPPKTATVTAAPHFITPNHPPQPPPPNGHFVYHSSGFPLINGTIPGFPPPSMMKPPSLAPPTALVPPATLPLAPATLPAKHLEDESDDIKVVINQTAELRLSDKKAEAESVPCGKKSESIPQSAEQVNGAVPHELPA